MSRGTWLTKSEVNSHYYNTVSGEIVFATEAQAGAHPLAVAKLIARQAESIGKREIRILEIGANNCAFARSLLALLRQLAEHGETSLRRVDYLAVEYARNSLDAAVAWERARGGPGRIWQADASAAEDGGAGAALVALLTQGGPLQVNLGLVHAEANRFARETGERFDFVIMNELLDDMPYTAYYSDTEGARYELAARSHEDEAGWTVHIDAEVTDDPSLADMPPGTLTARSPESVELVQRVAELLGSGGMLLMHDYGFSEEYTPVDKYEALPKAVPSFSTLEFPEGSEQGFPRGFFRVFGNDEQRVVQVTNDVNFAEIAAALEPKGTVIVLHHGNAIANQAGSAGLERGDGVFLSEFPLLGRDDDLPALLAQLHADQSDLRDAYVRDYLGGQGSVFSDLIFVKS